MSPSRPFIMRPVATSLLMAAILLVGIVAYTQLPVSALPQVDYPTIQVVTFYPGASPYVMATTVTAPLERQFGQLQGLSQMTSTSSGGTSVIVLQFNLSLDIDIAEQEVQSAINASQSFLPSNLPTPPVYSKTNPADAPVLTLAITSTTVPLSQVEDLVDTRLAPKLSQLSGVGLVSISGGQKPAVRIRVNPVALSSYGVNLEDLRTALIQSSVNAAKGNFDGPRQNFQIDANDQLVKSSDYRDVVIAYRNGAAVQLSDVADVVDDVENSKQAAWMNQTPAVILNVQRQPGANTISVVKSIKQLLPQLEANLPASVQVTTLTDLTTSIQASVSDVKFELLLTVGLVVMVIFIFLRSFYATIIPSVAVPLSLIGTFAAMYALGYSLDNLSLMALTISTGFVVDDAIVVLENITRHIEDGMKPYEAALKGASEIGFTVMSMSISLIAVFIPILMMGGIVGRLFREFAVVLSVAIAVSLAVSLSTTPMMCARFLRHDEGRHGRLYNFAEGAFNRLVRGYDVGLTWVLRHQFITLLILFATIATNVMLFRAIPKGFFPQQDTGRINGLIQGDQDISFSAITAKMEAFSKIVQEDPAVDTVSAFTGGGNGTNTARLFMQLKPKNERKASADQIIARLRGRLAKIPGASLYLQSVQDVNVGGRVSGAQYQYTLQADQIGDLTHWAPILMERMRKVPELRDVNSDQQLKGLQASVVIDRDTAYRLGVSIQAIDDTLNDAFGQRQVSVMYEGINQYYVVMEVLPEFQQHPDYLSQVYVASSTGKLIPLSAFSHFAPSNSPLTVNHQGVFPAITLSFNLAPNASLGDAVRDIQTVQRQIAMPATIHATFQGTAQAFQDSLSSEPVLILAALATVYIVLGILYESYIHPITILSTLPSAGVGALLALRLFNMDLSIIALIGIILLIGIVKKNAILMIDFALQTERQENKSAVESIHHGALLRFRPIMMTTMAALLGAVPLAIGGGDGSELRRPLGVAIVGGLIVSQMLTIFTTPVVYVYLDRLQTWLQGTQVHAPASQPASAHSD